MKIKLKIVNALQTVEKRLRTLIKKKNLTVKEEN